MQHCSDTWRFSLWLIFFEVCFKISSFQIFEIPYELVSCVAWYHLKITFRVCWLIFTLHIFLGFLIHFIIVILRSHSLTGWRWRLHHNHQVESRPSWRVRERESEVFSSEFQWQWRDIFNLIINKQFAFSMTIRMNDVRLYTRLRWWWWCNFNLTLKKKIQQTQK